MALNRSEQLVADYLQNHPEERNFWVGKVQKLSAAEADPHVAAHRLETELWQYYKERSGIVPAFREAAKRDGPARVSMRNLSEYLIHLWGTVRTPKTKPDTI